MTDKNTNRIFGQPNEGDDEGKTFQFNLNGQDMTFAFKPVGEDVVVQTPFGIIKLSIGASEDIGDIDEVHQELAKLFGGDGFSTEKLQELLLSLPPVQELMAQAPQFQEMLEQAMDALAQNVGMPGVFGVHKNPKKKAANKAKKSARKAQPFKPEGLTFERFYRQQNPN